MADLLRCRSVLGLPPRDRRSWVSEEEVNRRRSMPANRQASSPEKEEQRINSSLNEVRIEIPELFQLPGPPQ
jgi:hypothetical protein